MDGVITEQRCGLHFIFIEACKCLTASLIQKKQYVSIAANAPGYLP